MTNDYEKSKLCSDNSFVQQAWWVGVSGCFGGRGGGARTLVSYALKPNHNSHHTHSRAMTATCMHDAYIALSACMSDEPQSSTGSRQAPWQERVQCGG